MKTNPLPAIIIGIFGLIVISCHAMDSNKWYFSDTGTNRFLLLQTSTNSWTIDKSQMLNMGIPEPVGQECMITMHGYRPLTPWNSNQDYKVSITWSNITISTKYVPIVSKSNDTYYINLKDK